MVNVLLLEPEQIIFATSSSDQHHHLVKIVEAMDDSYMVQYMEFVESDVITPYRISHPTMKKLQSSIQHMNYTICHQGQVLKDHNQHQEDEQQE
eukprot:8999411-Ditylum_brightwellii.AAC.1